MNRFYYSLPTHYKLTTKVLQTSTDLYSSTRVWLRNPEFADVKTMEAIASREADGCGGKLAGLQRGMVVC